MRRSPERVATARTVGLQHGVARHTRLPLPAGEGWGEGVGENPVVQFADGSWGATMIRKSRMGAMNRGARKNASGPHPGLLPGGEGEYAPRVSEG